MKAIWSRCRGSMFDWILKTNPEKRGSSGAISPSSSFARPGRRGVIEKAVEQQLHAEVVDRAAEEDGGHVASQDGRVVEGFARPIEHGNLLQHFLVQGLIEPCGDLVVGQIEHGDRRPIGAPGHPLEKGDQLPAAVENTPEVGAGPEGPVHGVDVELQRALDLVQQRQRLVRRPVELVDEREDGDLPEAADLEELERLALDPLGRVEHHDDGVDGHQHAVGVLREILVAGRVQQVDAEIPVLELEHGRADRDAALALELHPVGGRVPLVFPGRHRPCQMDGAAVQQQLFRQGRLAGVGVRDDRERPSPRNLFHQFHTSPSRSFDPHDNRLPVSSGEAGMYLIRLSEQLECLAVVG